MVIPIIDIPQSIVDGLEKYQDLFPRSESFQHLMEYATGLIVLEKPSIRRLSECLVDGPDQSCINKMLTQSPWDEEAINQRRLEIIASHYKGKGLIIGILDSTLLHHPRSENIYGAYKYWDYVNNCYTKGIQLVTSAISTDERCDGFDYRIYHRFFKEAEEAYLQVTCPNINITEENHSELIHYLADLLAHINNKRKHKTKPQFAVEIIKDMEKSELAPNVYVVDSSFFAPVVIQEIESHEKPWVADSEKSRVLFDKGRKYNLSTISVNLSKMIHRDDIRQIKINCGTSSPKKENWQNDSLSH